MTSNISLSMIKVAIDDLYLLAGATSPTSRCSIAPLGELVGAFNLACKELSQLTQRAAMHYLAQQGGIIEPPETQEQEPLAGFLYVNTHYGCIFSEQDDLLVRRRFSVAHELGHYLLHFRPLLKVAERDQEYLEITESLRLADDTRDATSGQVALPGKFQIGANLPPYEQMEREANQFAAELLMPADVVRGLFARSMLYLREEDLVRRLATEMLVSEESMSWRLKHLSLLPLPGNR